MAEKRSGTTRVAIALLQLDEPLLLTRGLVAYALRISEVRQIQQKRGSIKDSRGLLAKCARI